MLPALQCLLVCKGENKYSFRDMINVCVAEWKRCLRMGENMALTGLEGVNDSSLK